MPLQVFTDYVFVPKVSMITSNGVFVGTKNYVFCVPSKIVDHEYRKVTTTKFSFKGKEIHEAVADIVQQSQTTQELEENLLQLRDEFPEMTHFNLNEVESFKVQAGFLGSGIHVQKAGKRGWSPFIQQLGKDKKAIQSFYADHPKLK